MSEMSRAEWLLARFVGSQQSAAWIGDLLEQRPARGTGWFWRSFASLLFAAAWRPLLAFVAAVSVSVAAYDGLITRIFGMRVTLPLETVLILGFASWFNSVYSGVRYGVRDAFPQVAAAAALLATASIFLWRYPAALECVAAVAIGVSLIFSLQPAYRSAVAAVLIASVVLIAGFFLMAYSSEIYIRYGLHLRVVGTRELEAHPSINYLDLGLQLFAQAASAWTCAKLHHSFLKRRTSELRTAR